MFIQKSKKLHILIVAPFKIPSLFYGGTERVIWDLGKTLSNQGFKVSFLVLEGSQCNFANILILKSNIPYNDQIPNDVDLVHFNLDPKEEINKPYLVTVHGNPAFNDVQNIQSVFVSKNHAERYGSDVFVYNGLDWDNYQKPELHKQRNSFHFLANAAWRLKNVKGAIKITKKATEKLTVLGGYRFNIRMGLRLTFDNHVSFKGMVNNHQKSHYISQSKGLIFPVLWHEPFGLAIIESLYFGCPIFATPYGSLSEIVLTEFGVLSNKQDELVAAIKQSDSFDQKKCSEYAVSKFSAIAMTANYIELYEKVLNGEILNAHQPKLIKDKETKFLPYS